MTTKDERDLSSADGVDTNVVALPANPQEPAHRQVANFVHDHPMLTIAGGLAVGAVAAALIPRRNRKFVARRSSMLAEAVTAAATALAQQAISQASSASSAVRDQAESLADRAGSVGESTLARAQSLFGNTHEEPTFREKIAAKAGEFRGRLER